MMDYLAVMNGTWLKEDRQIYTIIDLESASAAGLASYMRIEPRDGSVEVGGIIYSPRQRGRSHRHSDPPSKTAGSSVRWPWRLVQTGGPRRYRSRLPCRWHREAQRTCKQYTPLSFPFKATLIVSAKEWGKRSQSVATRKKIGDANRKRWAERKKRRLRRDGP
jgi:hypothetical protein